MKNDIWKDNKNAVGEEHPLGEAPVIKRVIETKGGSAETIYFSRSSKQVICITSQLNCKVGCTFCASTFFGAGKKSYNINVEEYLDQVEIFDDVIERDKPLLISFMGEGEPLLNYRNMKTTMIELSDLYQGYDLRFSFATSVLSSRNYQKVIDLYQRIRVPVKLQVSLNMLDPVMRQYEMSNAPSTDELFVGLNHLLINEKSHGMNVDLNYVCTNYSTTDENKTALVNFMIGIATKYNYVIPNLKFSKFNPFSVDHDYDPVSDDEMKEFVEYIEKELGYYIKDGMITTEIHKTDGSTNDSACGQISSERV